ncbi:hypothetical protein BJV74DRAFT_839629 [Russula compacta]|nr:hypothetical protein BJV74DRAFT_839629 [Russula compacta]
MHASNIALVVLAAFAAAPVLCAPLPVFNGTIGIHPITMSNLTPVMLSSSQYTDDLQLQTVSSTQHDNNNSSDPQYGLILRDSNPEPTTGMTSDDLEFLQNILSSRSDSDSSTNPSTFGPEDISSLLESLGSDSDSGVQTRGFLSFLKNIGSSVVNDVENLAPVAEEALTAFR